MYGKIVKIKSLFCSARWKIAPSSIKTDLICTRACVLVDLISVLVYPMCEKIFLCKLRNQCKRPAYIQRKKSTAKQKRMKL